MRLLERRFQVLIFATVVSKSCAIEKSVSPRLTRYVTRTTSVGVVIAADSALDAMARDATAVGAARSVRAASSVAGARGMISSWPGRSRDRVVRLLASATSARETPNRRATVRSVSPLLAVYHFSAEKSAGEAAASFAVKRSAVPLGTFISYFGYLTGVVQRRSSGFSAWISSTDVPAHSATRRKSMARGIETFS